MRELENHHLVIILGNAYAFIVLVLVMLLFKSQKKYLEKRKQYYIDRGMDMGYHQREMEIRTKKEKEEAEKWN